jgi:chemotaxis protein histidine kinase CheA
MTSVAKKIHFPTTRLAELAARSGGITRDLAVEEAAKSVQNLLGVGLETIETSTRTIETIAYAAKDGKLCEADLKAILRDADHIVTMAATFGFSTLEEIGKCLCDVVDGLISRGLDHAAPVVVHVQAMRLAAPKAPELGEKETVQVLAELARVRDFYEFVPLSAAAPSSVNPPELAE